MRNVENPVNLPIGIKDGCKGCGGLWGDRHFYEGQCLRCKRCLNCCGDKSVKYSCAWKYERDYGGDRFRAYAHAQRSRAAYDRYISNPAILPTHRRIF